MTTAQVYRDTAGEWRFRMRANNNETIAVSEGYTNKQDAITTAQNLGATDVTEVDQ